VLRRVLKTIGDERTARDLGALAEKESKREAGRLRRLIKGLPAPEALSAADRATWEQAFGGKKRDKAAEREALIRAVLERRATTTRAPSSPTGCSNATIRAASSSRSSSRRRPARLDDLVHGGVGVAVVHRRPRA